MATTRIIPLHVGKGRTESRAISDIIDYVANSQKIDNGRLITGYACDSRTADAEFLLAKHQNGCFTGHQAAEARRGFFRLNLRRRAAHAPAAERGTDCRLHR